MLPGWLAAVRRRPVSFEPLFSRDLVESGQGRSSKQVFEAPIRPLVAGLAIGAVSRC